jgi:predicted ATPase/DNA-binding CsgD family transcriptional regulator
MAQVSPIILNGILTDLRDGSAVQIVVDSSDWYAWLQTASTFTFRGEEGLFTAHKERAGHRRGRAYWRAYRTWHGKLHQAYLGQSEELTLERLRSVAVALASKETGNGLLDVPGLGARTRSPAEAASRARTHRRRTTGAQGPHEAARSQQWLARFPVPLTALIGREQEVRAICDLLSQPEVRLLTITGTGGVGKTRLALEVAGVLRADFADGACFVPLAPVSDPARVLAAIAQALGLWEAGDLPVEEQLHAALRERRLLLLLDNFEQVVQAAPQLASLLASCPRLRLLVTSRATLHLSGEHEFPVLPLAVPNLTQLPSPETLTQQAAVRLFVLRAQAIQPAFHVTPANACAIAEICVHLDGLPLAIELAAARSKLLPPQALLARLSRRLEVLTGGARDLPTRQQTLRNTLQWSYDLLTEQEQRLFRRLSIFVGGCTLEAAEAVCQAGGDQASSVLEGIASLLDKSLVQQTEREGGEPRLVMLETIREFGLECLHRQGELQAARQAHARYYLALAEQAEPHFFGPEQLLWVNRLERDLDNLRAILQAQACLEEALTSARALGDRYLLFHALLNLGRLALYQQDAPRAIAWYEESLIQGKAMGAKLLIGRVLVGLARAELSVGHAARTQLSQAEAFLTDSTRLATEVGDRRNVARSRLLLAGVAALRGDHAAARQWYEEGLSTALDIGHVNYIGAGLKGLGCVAAAQGLPTWAAVLWGTAEPLRESRSLAIPLALHERMVAEVRRQLGEPAFEEARARGRTMTAAQALASHEAFAPQATPRLPPAQAAPGSSPTAPAGHPSSPAGLTAREVEVLRLVSQGLTDAQVAEQLVISLRTVTTHLTSIYNKLGVNSRVAATRFAVEHQLV